MRNDEPQLPLEVDLAELAECRQAGVFGRTPMPALGERPQLTIWRFRVLGPFAAAAMLAFVVGGYLFQRELGQLRGRAVDDSSSLVLSQTCFRGPGIPVTSECRIFDRDADGDADLADFSAQQRFGG